MGYIESETIDSMLNALGKVLVDLGWKS